MEARNILSPLLLIIFFSGLSQDHGPTNPKTQNYNMVYQRMEWSIDPDDGNDISGTITCYFIPNESGFDEFNIDFTKKLDIDDITYHGNSVSYDQGKINLEIDLNATVPQGSMDSITIEYNGNPNSGFYNDYHNGTPIVYSFSQSDPIDARQWWPCKQDLGDKLDSCDIYLTVTKPYVGVANGLLLETDNLSQNRRRYHFRHRYPISPYLVAIAATNYEKYTDNLTLPGNSTIKMVNYVFPEDESDARNSTDDLTDIFDLFNELFGPYPFKNEQYGHAQINSGAEGIEHQTMSFVDHFELWLLAHEVIHQWFGDQVTAGDWSDMWLHEGFGHYAEGLIIEHGLDSGDWDDWIDGQMDYSKSQPNGSVVVEDGDYLFDFRTVYVKSSMVVHMMRWMCHDDDLFYQTLRDYLNDPALNYAHARTRDIKSYMETATGKDLTEFYNDWIYGEGYPTYTVSSSHVGNTLWIELDQSTSYFSVDFFELDVPIYVSGEGQDTLLVLDHHSNGQSFGFTLDFEPEDIEFDPDQWLMTGNNVVYSLITGPLPEYEPSDLHVYPTQLTALDEVKIHGQYADESTTTLFSLDGKILVTGKGSQPFGGHEPFILSSGIYQLHITSPDGRIVPASVFISDE